jgi:hypothetical protein
MNFSEAQAVLTRIKYKPNWMACLDKETENIWRLWAVFDTIDTTTYEPVTLEGRVWFITSDFSEDDLIHTCFMMFKQMEEHETMEFFRVDGYPIFSPHISTSAHKGAVRATFDAETLALMGLPEVQ